MASFSLSSLRKDACNGNSVFALSVDGVQVMCFIGWMQQSHSDMISLNTGGSAFTLSAARALAGFKTDGRYTQARDFVIRAAALFARQQTVAMEMNPLHMDAKKRAYVLELQGFAAHNAQQAQAHVIAAGHQDGVYDTMAEQYREQAAWCQHQARMQFQRIADVRGFFDTPSMDDAHAVECEPSKVEAAKPEPMADKRTSYREKAFNAYGRYAVYCARADVAPYPFAEWFADVYSGHEDDPAANWN